MNERTNDGKNKITRHTGPQDHGHLPIKSNDYT